MKVHTKIVIDLNTNQVIEDEYFNYEGPIASCDPVTAAVGGAAVLGAYSSNQAAKASRSAAGQQAESAAEAIAFQRESRDLARADLQPFREAGQAQLDPLSKLISDPQAQLSFIQDNPFFTALANDSQSRLFSNQAARGKVGSGGTAEALQNSLLLLGQDLLNQNIGQRFNLATMGQNAAAGQGTATLQAGSNISELITGRGNALAAGQVGAANAQAQGINNLFQTGLAYGLMRPTTTVNAASPVSLG